MKSNKPTSPTKVTPEVGWALHSPFGTLHDARRNPLERLEVVHALLMKRDGLSSMDAAVRIFGPFVADANSDLGMKHGADKLRPHLMVCDLADKAYPLFPVGGYADRSHLDRLADLIPHLQHHHFDKGTPQALLYALGTMAGEVWAPYSGDVDLNDRPCADFAEGYFPSAAKAREILGPLAVSHNLAHSLWGWGAVGEVVQLHAVQTEVEPTTWITLVSFRKAHDGAEWTAQQKRIAADEAKHRKGQAGATMVAVVMAKELGLSVSRFNDLIRNADQTGKRQASRLKSA